MDKVVLSPKIEYVVTDKNMPYITRKVRNLQLNNEEIYIDNGCAEVIYLLNKLGYTTEFHCSGLDEDHIKNKELVTQELIDYYLNYCIDWKIQSMRNDIDKLKEHIANEKESAYIKFKNRDLEIKSLFENNGFTQTVGSFTYDGCVYFKHQRHLGDADQENLKRAWLNIEQKLEKGLDKT